MCIILLLLLCINNSKRWKKKHANLFFTWRKYKKKPQKIMKFLKPQQQTKKKWSDKPKTEK